MRALAGITRTVGGIIAARWRDTAEAVGLACVVVAVTRAFGPTAGIAAVGVVLIIAATFAGGGRA